MCQHAKEKWSFDVKKGKALLVDTNRAAVPIYKYLESQGLQVTVVGGDPDETLAKMAKHYVCLFIQI